MATITGDHVGYPGCQDLGDFSPKKGEKSWGAKIRTSFGVKFLQFLFVCFADTIEMKGITRC
jgi:hypothetical protein